MPGAEPGPDCGRGGWCGPPCGHASTACAEPCQGTVAEQAGRGPEKGVWIEPRPERLQKAAGFRQLRRHGGAGRAAGGAGAN